MKSTIQYLQNFFSLHQTFAKEDLDYAYRVICFLQHERLVHLLVTLFTFAGVLFLGVLTLVCDTVIFRVAGMIALILLLCYIHYYYFLENSIQELYQQYIQARECQNDTQEKESR